MALLLVQPVAWSNEKVPTLEQTIDYINAYASSTKKYEERNETVIVTIEAENTADGVMLTVIELTMYLDTERTIERKMVVNAGNIMPLRSFTLFNDGVLFKCIDEILCIDTFNGNDPYLSFDSTSLLWPNKTYELTIKITRALNHLIRLSESNKPDKDLF
ncbi:MAG: hypothetical protein OXD44_07270 [Gammaproteobacteria bacterium]|nr:hypothetical protein [Gammaproteobacteria bacterium]